MLDFLQDLVQQNPDRRYWGSTVVDPELSIRVANPKDGGDCIKLKNKLDRGGVASQPIPYSIRQSSLIVMIPVNF